MKKLGLLIVVLFTVSVVYSQERIKCESGLEIEIKEEGEKLKPAKGNKVWVKYIGKLAETGKVFEDGSDDPVKFTLGIGEVMKGWDEGVPYLGKGGKAVLYIPSELGYGKKGSKDYYDETKYTVPPNADLIFEIEVVKFK